MVEDDTEEEAEKKNAASGELVHGGELSRLIETGHRGDSHGLQCKIVSGEGQMTSIDAPVNASRRRATPWALIFAAGFLAVLGLGVVGVCVHGFITGWLTPAWTALTDTQVSLVSNVATLYAAAFAATIAPLIFRGQVNNLERASEDLFEELRVRMDTLTAEQQKSSQKVLEIAEQSKDALSVLQNHALHMMGFVDKFTEADLQNAKHILLGFQESAAILAQKALNESNKWQSTKAQFAGKWPGYAPYIHKLHECAIISDDQRAGFLEIADSRRYTRENHPETIDLVRLNILNKTMRDLQESFVKAT
ncbi:MAG: hypothetical protein R3C30_12385 [Hyphomonadaceae bacterium]